MDVTEKKYLSTAQTAKHFGVHPNTVRKWDSEGIIKSYRIGGSLIGHRRFDISTFTGKIDGALVESKNQPQISTNKQIKHISRGAIYCRVSSSHQKEDLDRQINFMQKEYPNFEIFKDVASGINFKRPGFLKLIERSIKGDFDEIVVAHRDRFSRFAFDFIKWLLEQYNIKLVVLNDSIQQSKEQELAEDLLSIIHVFSCRQNGRRKYKSNSKSGTESDYKSETDSEPRSEPKSEQKNKKKGKKNSST